MIEVEDLQVFYGEGRDRFHAVRDVSFRVEKGETYGLVGESGSGKSSVLNAIAGRHSDWTGTVRLAGAEVDPRRRNPADRQKVQIVFQDPFGAIHPKHTIGGTIAEPLAINRRQNRGETVDALLRQVGLPGRFRYRYPHQISGGQRQRVSIARALALQSPILLLDEPTSALDVSVQAEILNLLQDLRRDQGLTYLMVTHDIGVVGHMCDRIGVMKDGRIVEELTKAQLVRGETAHPFTRELLSESLLG
ncbi:ABC transporter ATP-binding protein [Wenxinia saemankumensis]|uniref:ABC-type dipeptide/oligopeptide/nickel transport system, ATPase component n=1 Tax=Wenxinia saemankumensis TaxID=1447782 RepID=A0A1M6B4B0_9RHOB|nr:ABC transporter ATP-binding protein [Wenxinia saemankumensis]SHI43579.1 ABC-type dipeptide/oligopeptide/nickel transport system, ATPase component [Wenxinia saemankumensis]